MSIVLDVVQQIVLQKAYDLTCEVAIRALRRYTDLKHVKGGNHKLLKSVAPLKSVCPPEVATPMVKPKAPRIRKVIKFEGRDMPRTNSGMIDPPQCSCMRICRDSYFS
ncbi:uncharacterized protein Dana_GF12104 [Drosophila ananassae]|uniref:Uncharacterized protein n=1 Tax=Drosophila ananassae TaxID=7217 RepID=B3MBX2_DROAN|nr:uncharacterized protein LOC6494962 [Drosophila ananassae]EDV36143.1 uncharacterized protein Dana_GF12104 [Drosophila ananassae]